MLVTVVRVLCPPLMIHYEPSAFSGLTMFLSLLAQFSGLKTQQGY